MKKTLVLSLVIMLAIGVAFTACGKKSDEKVKAEATQLVGDFTKVVADYQKWVTGVAIAPDQLPAFVGQNDEWNKKIADTKKKWDDNAEKFNKGLTPEDLKAFDTQMKTSLELAPKIVAMFQQKVEAAKNAAPATPEAAAPAPEKKK